MVPASQRPWEIPLTSNTAAPLVISAPGWEQFSAEQLISSFLSLCFSVVALVTEQRTGISGGGGVIQWTGPSIPWRSLFSSCIPDHWAGIFGIAFLSGCVQQELCDLNTITEGRLDPDTAFRNKIRFLTVFIWVLSEDKFGEFDHLPPGHCDMFWQQKCDVHLPLDYPSAFSSVPSSMKERQWEEQREVSSALCFQFTHKEGTEREGWWGGLQCFVKGNIFFNYPCLHCVKY